MGSKYGIYNNLKNIFYFIDNKKIRYTSLCSDNRKYGSCKTPNKNKLLSERKNKGFLWCDKSYTRNKSEKYAD